jgi:PIN domain nuclease of toxin-antitoxin system
MLNLDIHIAVALLDGSLSDKELSLASSQPLAISAIVLWELAKLVQLKRLTIDVDSIEFKTFLRSITLIPINWEIAVASTYLDIRSDPADEIIAATSIVEQIPLLTRDRKLLKSKMVPLAVR